MEYIIYHLKFVSLSHINLSYIMYYCLGFTRKIYFIQNNYLKSEQMHLKKPLKLIRHNLFISVFKKSALLFYLLYL